MAGSRFEYVRTFEMPDYLLPGTFLVFRLDGHAFHRFSKEHEFRKPNDERALMLMDKAAQSLMNEYQDIILAFGESDEYSFLLRKSTSLYNRRASKIISLFTSLFTASYIYHWHSLFQDIPLKYPPSFDGRVICYPSATEVRDYFSWRQTDTHINNLYNTVFWALVTQGAQNSEQAHARLKHTFSKDKHEIMFSEFNINYNDVEPRYRKGSVLVTEKIAEEQIMGLEVVPVAELPSAHGLQTNLPNDSDTIKNNFLETQSSLEKKPYTNRKIAKLTKQAGKCKTTSRMQVQLLHCDIIKDDFWISHPWLLSSD